VAAAAPAFAIEVRRTGLRIAGEDVLDVTQRRAAERVVDPLTQEIGEVSQLIVGEVFFRRARLGRVPALQKRPELAPVSIPQDDDGADQVRASVGASRLRPVTRDAARSPNRLAAVSRG
jgi:hypothetical protein